MGVVGLARCRIARSSAANSAAPCDRSAGPGGTASASLSRTSRACVPCGVVLLPNDPSHLNRAERWRGHYIAGTGVDGTRFWFGSRSRHKLSWAMSFTAPSRDRFTGARSSSVILHTLQQSLHIPLDDTLADCRTTRRLLRCRCALGCAPVLPSFESFLCATFSRRGRLTSLGQFFGA